MPPAVSPLERLEAKSGRPFPTLVAARERTAQRLAERGALLDGLAIERNATVALMGSWGRREVTAGSDDDYVVLVRGPSPASDWGAERDTAARIAERLARDPGGFGAPGRQGIFAEVVYSGDLMRVGLDDDTNTNLTRRMLLVLESVAACHADVLDGVRLDVIYDYVSDALRDHRPPRFLLNDLVRYWRTIGVDFVAKDRERAGAGWGLRNAKLRTSRKLLFASGLLPVLRCHELRAEAIAPFLAAQFAMPPTDRVADAFLRYGAEAQGAEALAAYDAFVALLDDETMRAELGALDSRAAAYASACWREVAELGATIEAHLLALLFETELGPITQRYAVF
ncbi:MAG TPA: DUF294 nucleotidyltransferase-like domain-containing protein [Conexibacter sp.]|nr:DUF294 nucleotidyltransferase-like domain-containing protein [Conexibacter sp.]